MLSLEEGIAIDGIFKMRKWSRSREMVFGHSIRRAFTGRIFSSCHSENLNGFEWIHWAMLLKKKGRVKLSCLQSCFWGASPKGTSDLLGPNVFSSRKKKNHWKSSQAPIAFPVFPGSLPLALTLKQLMWGWGVGPTPKDRKESPKQLYFSKGPGCRYHGTNASGHHTTVYTTVGRWSQIVGRMWPEAGNGKNASSTPYRSEDLLPAAQTGTWRL